MFWMLLLALFANQDHSGEPNLKDVIREWVYQAEVFERGSESMLALRGMLLDENIRRHKESHLEIIRAIALIKKTMDNGDTVEVAHLLDGLASPNALIFYEGEVHLLVGGTWIESGDWLGDYFLLEVDHQHVLMETRDGFRKDVIFKEPFADDVTEGMCYLRDASLREILAYVSRRAKLNSFLPSGLNATLQGTWPMRDWLALLDAVCAESNMTFTRRRDNVMFIVEWASGSQAQLYKTLEKKDENITVFMEALAQAFEFDLIMDERLAEATIDLSTQEQPWDETLDCLATVNGFNWELQSNAKEKAKLIITKAAD